MGILKFGLFAIGGFASFQANEDLKRVSEMLENVLQNGPLIDFNLRTDITEWIETANSAIEGNIFDQKRKIETNRKKIRQKKQTKIKKNRKKKKKYGKILFGNFPKMISVHKNIWPSLFLASKPLKLFFCQQF